ncbi:armadillo-type protein [Sporodiniella umbellata]|nr:armadillo-type protein [Sporodiniella umbellata]
MESFTDHLEAILSTLALAQDSETVKKATHALSVHFYVTSDCVPALIKIAMRSPHTVVRQLAAVELRKRIRKWWSSLHTVRKGGLRTDLLKAAQDEKDTKTRHSIIQVIASITYNEPWPDLVHFLYQACQSPDENHRDMALYGIYTVFEHMPDYFLSPQLLPILQKAMVDPSTQIRVTAVLVLGKLTEYKDSESLPANVILDQLIPSMLQVLQHVVSDPEHDHLPCLFEVFDTLLMLNTPLLTQHLPIILHLFTALAADSDLPLETRSLALSLLITLTHFQSKKLIKLNLLEPLIDPLMQIGTEEDPEDPEEETPAQLAFKALHGLAMAIESHSLFVELMTSVVVYLQHGQPAYRRSGWMAMAAMAEGCGPSMVAETDVWLAWLERGLGDPALSVRRAVGATLSCLASALETDFYLPERLLEPLLQLAQGASQETTRHLCCVLDVMVENPCFDLPAHLPRLLDTLCLLLHPATQTTVFAALGSLAHAAGAAFEPHAARVLPHLIHAMATRDPTEVHDLRGVACDALGLLAAAAPQAFAPHRSTVMHLALEQLPWQSTRLREGTFALVIHLAPHHDLTPYLDRLLPQITNSCRLDPPAIDSFEHYDYTDAEEEALAVEALAALFAHAPIAFLPYLDQTQYLLLTCLDHPLSNVRQAAFQSLASYIQTIHTSNLVPLPEGILPTLVDFWTREEDPAVVENGCQALTTAFLHIRPLLLHPCLSPLCHHLLEIYQNEANCQQCEEEEEDDDDDDDLHLLPYATKLLTVLCQIGPDFSTHFGTLLPAILPHTLPGEIHRSIIIHCLGECCLHLQAGITPYTYPLLKLFLQACHEPHDESLQSHSAFALGALIYHSTLDLSSHYSQCLDALSPLFLPHRLPDTLDHAASALARLILAHPLAVPLDLVLPVLIQALPLKVNFKENEPVFACLFELFRSLNPWVYQHLPQFLPIFHHVLSNDHHLSQNTKSLLIQLIHTLHSQNPHLNFPNSLLSF